MEYPFRRRKPEDTGLPKAVIPGLQPASSEEEISASTPAAQPEGKEVATDVSRLQKGGNMTQPQEWSASTDETIVPQLSAEFWSEGTQVTGKLEGYRDVRFRDPAFPGAERTGVAYRLQLDVPVRITQDGEEEDLIELPPLTGLSAAFRSLKAKGYQPSRGDIWTVRCVSIRKAKRPGFSDSPNFTIHVRRVPVVVPGSQTQA